MNRVRFWRLERGLSQMDLSHATQIPRYRIQLCEQGYIALECTELERIAEVLNVNVIDGNLSSIEESP